METSNENYGNYISIAKKFEEATSHAIDSNSMKKDELTRETKLNNAVNEFISQSQLFKELNINMKDIPTWPDTFFQSVVKDIAQDKVLRSIFVAKVLANGDESLLSNIPNEVVIDGAQFLTSWETQHPSSSEESKQKEKP